MLDVFSLLTWRNVLSEVRIAMRWLVSIVLLSQLQN